MGSVVIRNLDDAIIDTFKTKAELNGRSLEAELREALARQAPLTPDQKRALIEKVRIVLPPGAPDLTDLIREDRDSRWSSTPASPRSGWWRRKDGTSR